MLRGLSLLRQSHRRLCSAAATSPARQAAAATWDALLNTDWVDRETETQDELVEEASRQVEAYRSLYDASSAASGEGKETYEQIKALYQAKEAATIVNLYEDYIEHLIRHHEDMIGFLGNDTTNMPEGGADGATRTIEEYIDFVNGLENKDVKKKVEHELGRKIVVLKMVLSAENFSVKFRPIAGGDFVTNTKKE